MSGFSIYLVSVVGIGAHNLQVCNIDIYLRLEDLGYIWKLQLKFGRMI
jgi:hypothetical protein